MRKKLPNWIWKADRKRRKQRERILKRDRYSCQACGLKPNWVIIGKSKKLHIHHLDRNKNNNDDSNLVALCASCHITLHNKLRGLGV